MSDRSLPNGSSENTGNGSRPFPSRRDIHGSRIPVTKDESEGATADPSPPVNAPEVKTAQPTLTPYPSRASRRVGKPISRTEAPQLMEESRGDGAQGTVQKTGTSRNGVAQNGVGRPGSSQSQSSGPESIAAKKARSRKTKKAWRTALIIFVLLALVGAAVWWAMGSMRGNGGTLPTEANDYAGPGTGTVQVTIHSGDTGADIAQALFDAGVVKSVDVFTTAFSSNAAATTIRPGTYTLRQQMSAAGALAALLDEANRGDNSITVNPGQTVSQVKEKLVAVADFSEEEVNAALSDPAALGLPSQAGGNPEGWLAAGSYEFTPNDTPASIAAQMVAGTVETLKRLNVPEDQWQPVLIKASILEREVIYHQDLPRVARVIENRLTMPNAETVGLLQMDSTVLYGVGKYGGIPTAEDLADDNPYNTYRVKGLPPTPIATPSVEAIEATLNPEEGDWLYFVTVDLDTGETLFASTLEEQSRNQQLLDEWCANNEGRC